MSNVRFGITFGSSPYGLPDKDAILALPPRVEELGFDSMWSGDHILMHSDRMHSLTLLATYVALTKRITIGSSVLLLPLRPAAAVAKAVGTLDYLSGGRFVMGIGVGGEYAKEWSACGIPREERGRRMDEGIEIVRKLWAEDNAVYEGQFAKLEGVSMRPRPIQPGGPPIWIGGRSDAALRRAARVGDGWMSYLVSPRRFRESIAKIHDFADAAGRTLPESFTRSHLQFTYVGADRERARRQVAEYLGGTYNQDFEKMVDSLGVVGSPEQCAQRLREYVDAGVQHFIFRLACRPEETLDQLEVYAKEIVPLVGGG